MRGHAADAVAATKSYERVPKYTTVSFGMRELCPRPKSDSAATADAVAVIRFLVPRVEPSKTLRCLTAGAAINLRR